MALLYTIYYHGNAMDTDVPLPDVPTPEMNWAKCTNGDGRAYEADAGGWILMKPAKFEPGIVGVSRQELAESMGIRSPLNTRPAKGGSLSTSASDLAAANSPAKLRELNRR